METVTYVGLDVHKKMTSYCAKRQDGRIVAQGEVASRRTELVSWARSIEGPWIGAMEATLFTGWIYDTLKPFARELKVAHPLMLRAIAASKKKNDKIDAEKIADLVRCDLLPQCYMASREIRQLRQVLRYRNLVVSQAVRMKNKIAGLLMESGEEFEKRRLHGAGYFAQLLERIEAPDSVVELLQLSRSSLKMFQAVERRLVRALLGNAQLRTRLGLLMSIRGVGEVTALTWALEIADPHRFSSIAQAVSYCGLTSAQRDSGGKSHRGPLSKQRNAHLQTILIEAAKLAPRWNPQLAAVYERERARSNGNQATLAVARKLVAYLMAVDKAQRPFVAHKAEA